MPKTNDEWGDLNQDPRFQSTHWSLVVAAGKRDDIASREALASLCRSYWYPCYAYLRHAGNDSNQAQDLTQDFFVRLIESHTLQKADQNRGRFRDFLLSTLRNFVANHRRRERAERRGGGIKFVPLDFDSAESTYQLQIADQRTPEDTFLRQWALALLETVYQRLQGAMNADKSGGWFEQLKIGLTAQLTQEDYSQLASELNMTSAAIKQAVYRLRQNFRKLLRDEIARTSPPGADIDFEIGQIRRFLIN